MDLDVDADEHTVHEKSDGAGIEVSHQSPLQTTVEAILDKFNAVVQKDAPENAPGKPVMALFSLNQANMPKAKQVK